MTRLRSTLFAAALAALASSAQADFMFYHDGHSYLTVTSTPSTWAGAAADAASREFGGFTGALARIDNEAENDAIYTAMKLNIPIGDHSLTTAPDGGGGAYVWIGATDRALEGQWIWDGDGDGAGDLFWQGDENGVAAGGLYEDWGTTGAQNEPDDFSNNQDAAGISLNGWPLGLAGQWNDVAESNTLFYVVEFAGVPEPSSLLLTAGALLGVIGRRRVMGGRA
ncbi:hypothetical protein Mal64_29490 [Pseudobythopirellula maris]|uniref:C-type lectin domain-containing protein n=1 Tax=Pseudobythopirellula maris TaxID=2527991 RepID=A0A5C5ZJN7_9BACT|nr:PEP-CTERM sorting domain-containing protein [Pseudobythopirellula maris]TWT87410.1 hypothetical protein Mal64_29490 [Pseudobythopirellula maris]